MRKALLTIAFFGVSFSSFSQDVFDVGVGTLKSFLVNQTGMIH